MSDYKMVPVVATQEMLRAAQVAEMDHDDFEDWMYFSGREVAKQYTAMLAKAPPFVVTDEVVEKAFSACNAAYEAARNEGYVIEHSAKAGVRAAIEAVLGGGV